MKITQLAAKPQLIKLTLDDETIVEKYGEAIDFWVWDRQPIEHYFKMAQGGEDINAVLGIVKEMVLDEEGKTVLNDEHTLPPDVAAKAFNAVMVNLGK